MKLVRLLNELNTTKLLQESVEMFGDIPVLVNPDMSEVQELLNSVVQTRIQINLKGMWDPRGRVYIWDGGDEVDTSRHHIAITSSIIDRYGNPDENDFYNAFGDDINDSLLQSFKKDGMLIPFIIEYRKIWPGQKRTGQKYNGVPETPLSVTKPYDAWFAFKEVAKTPEVQRAFGRSLKESINESREADLYHWMHYNRLDIVLQENKLSGVWEHELPYTNKQLKGTSMSRNPYFYLGRPVRLVFDQEKLSQTNKIIPLDAERVYQYTSKYQGWEKSPDRNKRLKTLMAEEFVIGDIVPLNKYLKRIEYIDLDRYPNFPRHKEEETTINEMVRYSKQFRIPLVQAPITFQSHHPMKESVLNEFDIGGFKGSGDDDPYYEAPHVEQYGNSLVMMIFKGSWTVSATNEGAQRLGEIVSKTTFPLEEIEFAPGVSEEFRDRIFFGWGEAKEQGGYEVWDWGDSMYGGKFGNKPHDRPSDPEERFQRLFRAQQGDIPDWSKMAGINKRNGS